MQTVKPNRTWHVALSHHGRCGDHVSGSCVCVRVWVGVCGWVGAGNPRTVRLGEQPGHMVAKHIPRHRYWVGHLGFSGSSSRTTPGFSVKSETNESSASIVSVEHT